MTKRELVVRISEETGIPQDDVYAVVQKSLDYIADAVTGGDRVEFREFGVFELSTRRARIGRNPKRPEHTVLIPEHQVVKFKPGKRMREHLAKR
ncbi:MAG: integration host factor subunit beta [Lentisphaerae bacterium]|nr:integration host factor subunit beta [Lentisphaerota bacterium]